MLAVLGVLLVALVGGSVLWFTGRTGVPPVPSSAKEIADVVALLRAAGLPERPRIYELGCGFGGLALALARAFPEATVVGLEVSPLPAAIAWLRARGEPRLTIHRMDYTQAILGDADAATAYLMIRAAAELAPVLDVQLRPGTAVVASMFWFRDRTPTRKRGQAALYRWPARGLGAEEP
ncbi:MAG: class I SAM-dependent methyltransferase [Deltaproteobacteria bacterium]|nr:class I SAM-dependent methyltransferase [Deltaproteobacteria bacterium]